MANLGAHGIVHFPAEEYMARKFRVNHFVLCSATSKPVKRVWCFVDGRIYL